MDNEDKLRRQRKLAKVFLEMGMDLDLIEQISGLNKEEFVDIQEQTIYNIQNREIEEIDDTVATLEIVGA